MADLTRYAHPGLAAGRWYQLSLDEQMGNVGSEVSRALTSWRSGNEVRMLAALARALELLDLTSADPRLVGRLREIRRAREVLADFLVGGNVYGSTAEFLQSYFDAFALAARRGR
ncbi:MAG: hypothetical protein ACT4OS_11775 [Acidimicrobiales bacterium]